MIAPTRSDFEEGFNKSCVEAVLANRPFISSPVCPAVYSLSGRIVVPPDDVAAYREALVRLADDPFLYRKKVRGLRAAPERLFQQRA